jgi:hypothetical protein
VEPLQREADYLVFPPTVRHLFLKWKPKADAKLYSFDKAVNEYKDEYEKRYADYIKAGNKPFEVKAPHLYTAEERIQEFENLFGPQEIGIAVGKPVTTSSEPEMDHRPEFAVDGNAQDKDGSSWWVGPPAPQWMQIDLEESRTIDKIRVYPYWDNSRFYRYRVDISQDAENWQLVGDMSQNSKPGTSAGDVFRFDATAARYVRVTMLYNSANPSMHVVEVRVYEPEK